MSHDPSPHSDPDNWLLRHASRAAVWNALLLPLLAAANLGLSIVLRRTFGLGSGVYDILLGLASALLLYSGFGIPRSLPKFLPEVASTSDIVTLRRFLRSVTLLRFVALGLMLVPVNVFARPLSEALGLGASGPAYLGWLSVMVLARAGIDLAIRTLNAFFAQFWSNLCSLSQAGLDFLLVAAAILLGGRMQEVVGGLAASAALVAVVSLAYVWTRLDSLSRQDIAQTDGKREPVTRTVVEHLKRLTGFGLFTYAVGLLAFFGDMAFVAPALALVSTPDDVAIFALAFKLPLMTITLVIAAFRGLYQPIFARLRARSDPAQLQRAFSVITRGQLLLLLPAGLGLGVMSGDYIPLLFGTEFLSAVPVTQVLVGSMYGSAIFNVPGILLTVDERYRVVLLTRLVPVAAAPLFLLIAHRTSLVPAAIVFGGASLASSLLTYAIARRVYGLRFPWAFSARVASASLAMAVIVGATRMVWSTSPVEAVLVTLLGFVVFVYGLRVARVLGADEIDLLRRSRIPGYTWMLSLLAPPAASRGGADGGRPSTC